MIIAQMFIFFLLALAFYSEFHKKEVSNFRLKFALSMGLVFLSPIVIHGSLLSLYHFDFIDLNNVFLSLLFYYILPVYLFVVFHIILYKKDKK